MEELTQMLISPAWWFSVVVVGIIINLFSAYAKPSIDERLSKISTWWRNQTEQQKAERNAFIAMLSKSEHEQIMASSEDLRHRLRSLHFLLLGIFILLVVNSVKSSIQDNIIVQIITFAFAAVCFYFSYTSFDKAATLKKNLNLARKISKEP